MFTFTRHYQYLKLNLINKYIGSNMSVFFPGSAHMFK